jgi:hypothetical protein
MLDRALIRESVRGYACGPIGVAGSRETVPPFAEDREGCGTRKSQALFACIVSEAGPPAGRLPKPPNWSRIRRFGQDDSGDDGCEYEKGRNQCPK